MGYLAWHYLIVDFYDPVWPNLAASVVVGVAVWFRLRAQDALRTLHHEEAMELHKEVLKAVSSRPKDQA